MGTIENKYEKEIGWLEFFLIGIGLYVVGLFLIWTILLIWQ